MTILEKLEEGFRGMLDDGQDRIDITAVIALIGMFKENEIEQLSIANVSNRRELLIAFFNDIHVEEIVKDVPMKIESIVDEWLKSN